MQITKFTTMQNNHASGTQNTITQNKLKPVQIKFQMLDWNSIYKTKIQIDKKTQQNKVTFTIVFLY